MLFSQVAPERRAIFIRTSAAADVSLPVGRRTPRGILSPKPRAPHRHRWARRRSPSPDRPSQPGTGQDPSEARIPVPTGGNTPRAGLRSAANLKRAFELSTYEEVRRFTDSVDSLRIHGRSPCETVPNLTARISDRCDMTIIGAAAPAQDVQIGK